MVRGLMGIPKLDMHKGKGQLHDNTYVIANVYSPKRKDELNLSKGDVVRLIEEQGDRCFVETVTKEASKQDRGWVPKFCLQKAVMDKAAGTKYDFLDFLAFIKLFHHMPND